jgi:mono/diheme cytochrome c family protein
MTRGRLVILGLLLAAGAAAVFCLMFVGLPRMYDQEHIRTGRAPMPPTPDGAVPVRRLPATMPTTREADEIARSLPATADNIRRGRVYYGYYCLACHGDAGDGRGPVAGSYIPAPIDLRSAVTQSRSDGELCRAMLTGEGHAPVLERVVPPPHRAYLVRYVRSLGDKDANAKAANGSDSSPAATAGP